MGWWAEFSRYFARMFAFALLVLGLLCCGQGTWELLRR